MTQQTSTTVLLGAGASAGSDYGLPVMESFFDDPLFTESDAPDLWRFVHRQFGSDLNLPALNLEEVTTHLFLIEEDMLPVSPTEKLHVIAAREQLDDLVYRRFVQRPAPPEGPSDLHRGFCCPQHRELFERLDFERGDSVLTLNYDLVADGTLFDIGPRNAQGTLEHSSVLDRSLSLLNGVQLIHGERPFLKRTDVARGYYLKLHGSVDWYYCPNRDCTNHRVFFQNWPGAPDVHIYPGDPCIRCGRRLVTVMVPPALGKPLLDFPMLSAIWSLAYQLLQRSSRWIIVGVSLAPSDYPLRVLLRQARSTFKELELVVVNPSEEHRARASELLHPETTVAADSLGEWLSREG